MAKQSKKMEKPQTQAETGEFVAVTFTDDMEHAKEYASLLKNNDIPAVLKDEYDSGDEVKNIAVMVPEEFIDEAHVVIESQDAYDDFYDLALEEDDDFGDDSLDEDTF